MECFPSYCCSLGHAHAKLVLWIVHALIARTCPWEHCVTFPTKQNVTPVTESLGPSATMYKALAASAKGDLRVPVEAFQPGESPQTFHSSAQLTLPVEFMDELSSFTAGEPNFSR